VDNKTNTLLKLREDVSVATQTLQAGTYLGDGVSVGTRNPCEKRTCPVLSSPRCLYMVSEII
jgi:hypothetical protein